MKAQKASRIGIVVSDDAVLAVQRIEGKQVRARVSCGQQDLKQGLRRLISSSPFVGRHVVIGLEGSAVLVESLVVPAGCEADSAAICAERLKGDPVFGAEHATLGVVTVPGPSSGPSMVMLVAVNKQRIAAVMEACRETSLEVHSVEASALAAWRAFPGTGLQVRLLRGERQDVVQAGVDGRLMFCRVVESPIALPELGATITRAASLLGGRFEQLSVCGPVDAELAALTRSLGLELAEPEQPVEDPAALGLSCDGPLLTEFTPPEELTLRTRRRVRRVRFGMLSSGLALLLVAGVLGFQRLSSLRTQQKALETEIKNRADAQLELAELQARLTELGVATRLEESARPGHRASNLWALLVNLALPDMMLDATSIDDQPVAGQTTGARVLSINVSGLAASGDIVRTYADKLLSSGAFSDVRVETSERVLLEGGAEGERFRIAAQAETH